MTRDERARVTIGPNEIHVWYVDLASPPRGGALSLRERERAERFHSERDRARFVAAHSAWRVVLSAYLETAPAAVQFGEEALGKPFVAQPATDLRFSATHSADLAAIAVARETDVGIDLEIADRPLADVSALADTCCSEAERRELAAAPAAERRVLFLRAWTRKEAYVKAIGKGLQVPLETVHVSFDERRCEVAPGWVVIPLSPGPRAIAALAAASSCEWLVRERWWPPVEAD